MTNETAIKLITGMIETIARDLPQDDIYWTCFNALVQYRVAEMGGTVEENAEHLQEILTRHGAERREELLAEAA